MNFNDSEIKADDFRSTELQVTTGNDNHLLTNVGVWSHDGKWVYYDLRSDEAGAKFDGNRIERVNVTTGEFEVVFEAQDGAHCGVVTASPIEHRIVFIHGPEFPSNEWAYSPWHRRGVTVHLDSPRSIANLDARDIVSPYTPGALRGGSHVHVFSGDGRWVSYTYEDHVLATNKTAKSSLNQRNVGVAIPELGPVAAPKSHPRNHDGVAFSVLVTKTHDAPKPGSDEISRAYSDAWVGQHGYVRPDGSRVARAIAFLGDVITKEGAVVPELFLVDLPEDVTAPDREPLCGTATTRPAPPLGVVQRRLTYTTDRKHPGVGGVRHWPRSSPDGSRVAFCMLDDSGCSQLWIISPTGENMRQLTHNAFSIDSAFTWRADGQAIACGAGGQVCEVDANTGATIRVSTLDEELGAPRPEAVVYSPDGSKIAFMRSMESGGIAHNQIFVAASTFSTD